MRAKILFYIFISFGILTTSCKVKEPTEIESTMFTQLPDSIKIPEGMVFVPGGKVTIGSNEGMPMEKPVFDTTVAGFFMDKSPVTVAQFATFVKETGYKTQAEDFGDAGIFDLNDQTWKLQPNATWHHPLGLDFKAAPLDHPVTQVSWNDAVAFASWAGKRLPTEIEWEHAARNGVNDRNIYSWGTRLVQDRGYKANTWTGTFPIKNTVEDGFLYTSPVGAFGENKLGLTDMGGNVWEWTTDWYLPYTTAEDTFVPNEESEKAQRGGSFMCHASYCHGYRVSARSHSTPETSLFHLGFRLVKDIDGS